MDARLALVLVMVVVGGGMGCAARVEPSEGANAGRSEPEAGTRVVAPDHAAETPPGSSALPESAGVPPILEPGGPHEPAGNEWRTIFGGVRVNVREAAVEFDGIVPIDAHGARAPIVYLEQVACRPDTKEHESLVMTRALASHVHAALLLVGAEPGHPASWTWDGTTLHTTPASGTGVGVRIGVVREDGEVEWSNANDWIVNERTREHPEFAWVFAGSRMMTRMGREVYDADGTGLVVGLATFGSEAVACASVLSHESAVSGPEWIADADRVPAFGTRVIVRLTIEE